MPPFVSDGKSEQVPEINSEHPFNKQTVQKSFHSLRQVGADPLHTPSLPQVLVVVPPLRV